MWDHKSIDSSHVEQHVGTWLHGNIALLPDTDIQFLTVHAGGSDSHKLRPGGATQSQATFHLYRW